MQDGQFFPDEVVDWMNALPYFYEDDHAIYVHAGLVEKDSKWLHPSETDNPTQLPARRGGAEVRGRRPRVVQAPPLRGRGRAGPERSGAVLVVQRLRDPLVS